jgi:SAM-dependent methyltransferase
VSKLQYLRLTTSWDQEMELIAEVIKEKGSPGSPIKILEAGCGQKWDVNLEGTPYVLTGVDLDEAALQIRMNGLKDLNEMIVGDLRTVQLAEGMYDVVFCSYVLEHIVDAESVLKNFVRWLKPGGLMILQIPDHHSVKGFITRITPHWVHLFYYRRVVGLKQAGQPGFGPYRTHYDVVVSRRGMREFCQRNHLQVKAEFGSGYRDYGHGLTRLAIRAFLNTAQFLSFGWLSSRHDDLIYVVEKC